MVKKQHKILCLVLCLAMIVSAVMVGSISASAAGGKVYAKGGSWSQVYVYMWSGSGESSNGAWPGQQMTKSGDEWVYTVNGDYENIIFNNGSGGNGNQTSDLSYPGDGQVYDLSSGQWSAHSGDDPIPTDPTPTTPTPSGDNVIYFKNTANWSTVNIYLWTDGGGNLAAWPGTAMKNEGEGVYSFTTSKKWAKCIFNNGGDQTGDLTATYGNIYDYGSGTWTPYTPGDLQISSFAADPADEIYPQTVVSLSAAAKTKAGGNVYYKFSVRNASGATSVISDYSTKSTVSWTPVAAGNYTLTLNVKDDHGNEADRAINLAVKADTNLTNPIIKSISPANLNLVKRNAKAVVSVKAGGGQTGTNLLFYKYIITDPNGVQNTPYYTLNSTYEFTPTKLGKYTVQVFVQASDNSDTTRTYTYTSTDSEIVDPTDPVITPTDPVITPTDPVITPTQPTTAPGGDDPGVLKGDADGNGVVNVKDATYVQKHVAEMEDALTINLKAADMDGDGKITVADATLIQILIAE